MKPRMYAYVLVVMCILSIWFGALVNDIFNSPEPIITEKTVERVVEVEVEKIKEVEVQIPIPQSCLDLMGELQDLAAEEDTTISQAVSSISELARQAHTAAMTDYPDTFVERTQSISEQREILSDALLGRAEALESIDTLNVACTRDLG